jgi:arsenate reductase-like glutaredoxin family protein
MYARTSCDTCKKAQAWLDDADAKPAKEVVNATKIRKGETEILALAKTVSTIVAAKGKAVVTIQMKDAPTDEELLAAMMGPTGNLRAPTLRIGKTLLVGYNAEAYASVVGT